VTFFGILGAMSRRRIEATGRALVRDVTARAIALASTLCSLLVMQASAQEIPTAPLAASRPSARSLAPGSPTRIVGYYPAWAIYDRAFEVSDLPGDKLTHVNYAFANLVGGQCVLGDPWGDIQRRLPGDPSSGPGSDAPYFGNFRQLDLLQEQYPQLKTLISVGGWTWSGNFSDAARTAQSREQMATSCAAFMETYGFDGIDIDWEYPGGGGLSSNTSRPEDPQNFTLLLAALREELDRRGSLNEKSYLLTIAAPAGSDKIAKIEVEQIQPYLDFINVMTYDFNGEWSLLSSFNAPLHSSSADPSGAANVDAALQSYLQRGVPPHKLVMGVPFYGRGVIGVANTNGGLYQPHTGAAVGTWDTAATGATGIFDYSDIVTHYLTRPNIQTFRDPEAGVPWLYDPTTGLFLSYDDPESLAMKRAYAETYGLGGVMIWEMSNDLGDELLDTLVAPTGPTVPAMPFGAAGGLAVLLAYAAAKRIGRSPS